MMEVGTEFYWDDADGYEQAYIVTFLITYKIGPVATLSWRDHTGRSLGPLQMLVSDIEVEIDELAGSWREEPRAEQIRYINRKGD